MFAIVRSARLALMPQSSKITVAGWAAGSRDR
jgi:hypothetical protein